MADQIASSPTRDFETLWGGEQAVTGSQNGRESRQIKYWKRPGDGFITIGPRVDTDPYDYQRFVQRKKYKELPDSYGFEMVGSLKEDSMTEGTTRLRKFIRNGGLTAKDDNGDWLMPGRQIVSLRMHRDANVRSARPDVVENAAEVECKYGCIDQATGERRFFYGWGKAEAERALDQHVSAVHGKAEAAEAIGQQNREALVEVAKMFGGSQMNGMSQEQMISMMAAAMVTAQKMMAEQGKITEVVGELYPKEDDVANVTEDVTLPTSSDIAATQSPEVLTRQDIESMSRADLISWASKHREMFKQFPTNPITLNRETWVRLYYESFYPDLLTS